jgi:hypothetical protein
MQSAGVDSKERGYARRFVANAAEVHHGCEIDVILDGLRDGVIAVYRKDGVGFIRGVFLLLWFWGVVLVGSGPLFATRLEIWGSGDAGMDFCHVEMSWVAVGCLGDEMFVGA